MTNWNSLNVNQSFNYKKHEQCNFVSVNVVLNVHVHVFEGFFISNRRRQSVYCFCSI